MDITQIEKAKQEAKQLVAKMTVREKASQLLHDAPGVERLGIPAYNWWNEALHGVARAGTATVFPQAIGLAAIFDDEYLREIADVIASEARAKYNENLRHGDRGIFKGLTMWAPNINIFRDPRWGRGHETYGEDPYLTARLGVAFVKGLQGDGEYLKTAACAKHFAVHSGPEGIRHEFDAKASPRDMEDTYLPAFEACVREAGVEAVMGAYNRTNGEPCCGSKSLLVDILRGKWGFDGHVVSDCWAIKDFHKNHMVTDTPQESIALAMKNGCDLNCGDTYIYMMDAYDAGLVTEDQITAAAERLFCTRYKLGMFDGQCEFNNIPYEVNDCAEHNAKSLEAARKSMVLLKNNGVLPLDKSALQTVAVIGPNADSQMMLYGNYYGTASRMVTVLEGIRDALPESARVYYSQGCHLYRTDIEDRISEAVAVAQRADVAILCLGLDSMIEGEEGDVSNSYGAGDKEDLNLPGLQQKLLEAVCGTGKPVVLVLGSGSALGVVYAQEKCDAILQAWYPGSRGGQAVADILFGNCSPGGKLPVTFYRSVDDLPEFTDYSMENRTYRYFSGECLYPFGYGLTYSSVRLSGLNAPETGLPGEPIRVSVSVTNTGKWDVEEVVQCYIKDMESRWAAANHSLCAFKRISLAAGETREVNLEILPAAMTAVNGEGERVLDSKRYTVSVGVSQPDPYSTKLTGVEPLCFAYTLH